MGEEECIEDIVVFSCIVSFNDGRRVVLSDNGLLLDISSVYLIDINDFVLVTYSKC
jgi:hypothetical protein